MFRNGRFSVVALAAGAVLSITSVALAQTTYYVNGDCGDDSWTGLSPVCEGPDGPKATIQAGINAADNFDIVEVADGVYRGAGNKNLEFFEKEMSIHSAGGPQQCIIDCENDGFGFTFCTLPNDQPVTIQGFTIRNGRHFWAGGICISDAEVMIDSCIIENCIGTGQGSFGEASGGIYVTNSPVVITRTVINGNHATPSSRGGGISVYRRSEVRIEDSHIDGNEAGSYSQDAKSYGGGVFVDSESRIEMARCTVNDNRVLGNTAGCFGGGIFIQGGSVQPSVIESTEIRGNVASAPNSGDGSSGGGLHASVPVVVRDCVIAENTAPVGAGAALFAVSSGSFELDNVQFIDNAAEYDAGGLYVSAQANGGDLRTLTFRGNIAGRDGGGVVNEYIGGVPTAVFEDTQFVDNRADQNGGGLYSHGDTYGALVTLRGCRFLDNEAVGNGGGAYGIRTIIDAQLTTFAGNRAGGDGGALHAYAPVLDTVLVSRNTAGNRGGGIFAHSTTRFHIRSTTLSNNTASSGGGLYVENDDYPVGNASRSLILWDNIPDSVVDGSGSLVIQNSEIEGSWPGVGNLDVDPLFIDAANGDYRLSAGSACIDAGNNDQSDAQFDLAGEPRRVDDTGVPDSGIGVGAIVDMGAYEFQGTSQGFITVHPRPGGAGRDNALQAAGATPGHVVYFVYGLSSGSTGVPGCPGVNVLIAHPRIAAQAMADGSGNASKSINIPGAASGQSIVLQAIDHEACGVSNVVRYRFP